MSEISTQAAFDENQFHFFLTQINLLYSRDLQVL